MKATIQCDHCKVGAFENCECRIIDLGSILIVLHRLFITTRTILEMSDAISHEQMVVDSENMDDLETAYQEVVKQFGPSHKGFSL